MTIATDWNEEDEKAFSPPRQASLKDRLESMRRQHEKDMERLRAATESSAVAPLSPVEAPSSPKVESNYGKDKAHYGSRSSMIATEKENKMPLSPNEKTFPFSYQPSLEERLESMKSKHKKDVQNLRGVEGSDAASISISRDKQGNAESEVASRIEHMREQHKKNMGKMRDALLNIKDDGIDAAPVNDNATTATSKDEQHIAECVSQWKLNSTRFQKAKARYDSWKSPRNPLSPSSRGGSHFSFDEHSGTRKEEKPTKVLSPRAQSIQELMVRNQELEEEMKTIRLASPKKETSKNYTNAYTPSSARYQTPRSTGISSKNAESDEEMSERISALVANVKNFLEENDERLMALKA